MACITLLCSVPLCSPRCSIIPIPSHQCPIQPSKPTLSPANPLYTFLPTLTLYHTSIIITRYLCSQGLHTFDNLTHASLRKLALVGGRVCKLAALALLSFHTVLATILAPAPAYVTPFVCCQSQNVANIGTDYLISAPSSSMFMSNMTPLLWMHQILHGQMRAQKSHRRMKP